MLRMHGCSPARSSPCGIEQTDSGVPLLWVFLHKLFDSATGRAAVVCDSKKCLRHGFNFVPRSDDGGYSLPVDAPLAFA
jgi:hypothetical protein